MNSSVNKWVAAILLCLALILPVKQTVLATEVRGKSVDPLKASQILDASLQIQMFAPTEVSGQYLLAKGLASLVFNGGEMQIVTHNHWGEIMKILDFVRFYDASEHLLVEMNGDMFKQSILEQDTGTLLLTAPKELKTAKQVQQLTIMASDDQVHVGDTVLLVHQASKESGKLALMEAVVKGFSTYKKKAAFTLYTLDGQPIISGDSGGGVWLNGQLVGNIWGRETVQPSKEMEQIGWLTQAPVVEELGYVARIPEVVYREGDY